jgi:oxygen-independent coproporphyrinogen-3 oxidase
MDDVRRAAEHLYVHVPFCDGTCVYCGFYSVPGTAASRAAYAPLPGRELRAWLYTNGVLRPAAVRTVYVGGGSPGALGETGLRALLEGLAERVEGAAVEEWTVELNPATLSAGVPAVLARSGVNRVSLGVQAFDDGVLRDLGRRHTAADAERALETLRRAGIANLGLDLIAGLPGVSPGGWREALDRAAGLDPSHISVYALTVEPGTPLANQASRGVVLPDEEAQLEALRTAEERLTAAGYERYEISNYARPGFACRHNLSCWRGEDFLGLGPAAASRCGPRRWTNRPDVDAYMAAVLEGRRPPRDEETRTDMEDASERFVFGLRLAEGADPDTHLPAAEREQTRAARVRGLERAVRWGAVERAPTGHWRLTPRGREAADAVMRELV